MFVYFLCFFTNSDIYFFGRLFMYVIVMRKVITTGSAWGKLFAVAGHHSFFRAVGSWSLDCQRWWTGMG